MLTILFVHAGTDDREMYADYLRAQGYAVIEASDTDSALLDLPSADLLLTGLMVPGTLTGVELIATARRKRQQLPVIVITASIVAEHHAAGRAAQKLDQYAARKVGHSEGGSFYAVRV